MYIEDEKVSLEELDKLDEDVKKQLVRYLNKRVYLWKIAEMYEKVFSEPDSKVMAKTRIDNDNLLLTIKLAIEGGSYVEISLIDTEDGLLLSGYTMELNYQNLTHLWIAYTSTGSVVLRDDTDWYQFHTGVSTCAPDLENEYVVRRLLTNLLYHALYLSKISPCVADDYLLIARRLEERYFPKEKEQNQEEKEG